MSKNLGIILIIILLVIGGFAVYTYNQTNLVRNELADKKLELKSVEEFIAELKATIEEKEAQIDELSMSLEKEKGDLEADYSQKLSRLDEEIVSLRASLIERENTIEELNMQKEETDKIIFSKDELIVELKDTLQRKEVEIEELENKLTQEKMAIEKSYEEKLSLLTKEKSELESQLAKIKALLEMRDKEKEELVYTLEDYSNKISELEIQLETYSIEEKQKYEANLATLTEEKTQLESQLAEIKGILEDRDQEKEELTASLEDYTNQISELETQLAEQLVIGEQDYQDKISLLTEEKIKAEDALKVSQELVAKRENMISQLNQQKDALEKNLAEKNTMIGELSENIKDYELKMEEIKGQMEKEGLEKEEEFATQLQLLTEEKTKLEIELKAAEGLLAKRENIIEILTKQKMELEKNIAEKNNRMDELSTSIEEYESRIQDLNDQIVKETLAKDQECAEELSKLIEEKDRMVTELTAGITEYETKIQLLKDQIIKEASEKEQECNQKVSSLTEERKKLEALLAEAIEKSKPDYYEVKRGDSLWKIAENFYNGGEKWRRIYEANRDIIENPSLIFPYQRFTIPKE